MSLSGVLLNPANRAQSEHGRQSEFARSGGVAQPVRCGTVRARRKI
jgi:hypothetical protein